MSYHADNAVIMAAGTASRFAPISYERPKALIEVRGEILIERQIRQLQEAGIRDIIIVTGYKSELFDYLADKFGVTLVHNPSYRTRNNNSSIQAVREYLHNTYICSADNYFTVNPFETDVDDSYYAAVYADGETDEWCMEDDAQGYVSKVTIGGAHAWYMMGHTFWNENFSREFLRILDEEYDLPETADKLWEKIFLAHLDTLKMKIRRYPFTDIYEFDTLDELRTFDPSYIDNAHSVILQDVCEKLHCRESEIHELKALKATGNEAVGFSFRKGDAAYSYTYADKHLLAL